MIIIINHHQHRAFSLLFQWLRLLQYLITISRQANEQINGDFLFLHQLHHHEISMFALLLLHLTEPAEEGQSCLFLSFVVFFSAILVLLVKEGQLHHHHH
uniref:Uncharacterized protein n=1 Tax=Opuntia streptacantha TaxID=393608 RepID=A0A7C9D9F5_OPUST